MTVTSRPFQYTTLRFTTKYKMFLSRSYFTVKWGAGTVELRGFIVEFQGSTVEYTLLYC